MSSIAISGSTAYAYTAPFPLPFVIPAGKSVNLTVKFKPTTSGSQPANLVVTHSGQSGTTTTPLSGGGGNENILYRINAGGGLVTNSIGTFNVDQFSSPTPGYTSSTYSTATAIKGPTDGGAIYQSERYGASFGYAFAASSGVQYKVVLHFAEIYYTTIGQRVFDVSIEGNKVLDNYDIVNKAGAFTAKTETFTVTVADDALNIDFSSLPGVGGVDNAKISAIEIYNLGTSSTAPPVANAGLDQTLTQPTSGTTLDGTGAAASGKTITGFVWNQVGTTPATAGFSSKTAAKPTVSGLTAAGIYTFALVVTDNAGVNSAADQVAVTVNSAQTTPPPTSYRLNAGGGAVNTSLGAFAADAPYFTPTTSFTYSTTAAILNTNDDALYQSERGSPTNQGTFAYALPLANGTYTVVLHFAEIYWTSIGKRLFDVTLENAKVLDNYDVFARAGAAFTPVVERLTVTVADGVLNLGFSASAADGGLDRPKLSALEVFGAPAGTNPAPVANAGPDQAITLPTSSVTLAGSGTDDGTVTAYAWTQTGGPAGAAPAALSGAATATLTASGLTTAGTYTFALVVTDNLGASSAADPVAVAVSSAPAGQQVVSFTLINADNEQPIPGYETMTSAPLNLSALPTRNLNIRANTNPATVGSVKFALTGAQIRNQTESGAPYALFGDASGNYNAWTPPTGSYSLTATPYTGSGASGTAGKFLTLAFSVSATAARSTASQSPALRAVGARDVATRAEAFPNPSGTGRFHLRLPDAFRGEVNYTLVSPLGATLARGTLPAPAAGAGTLPLDFAPQMGAAGVYYLLLRTDQAAARLKLLKE